MLRFCGQCGYSLTAAAFHAGRCPRCGSAIEDPGDVPGLDISASGDAPTSLIDRAAVTFPAANVADTRTSVTDVTPAWQPAERDWPDGAGSQVTLQGGAPVTRPRPTRQTWWALALLLAVPLVLIGTSILVLTQTGVLAALAPATSTHSGPTSSAAASASAGGATSTSATSTAAAVSHAPTLTPVPGATPSVTASPAPTATATPLGSPVAGPAYLSVSPTTFNLLTCALGPTIQFTVANTGGSLMSWSASTSNGYVITPGSGTIDAGGSQPVNVSNISGPGTITVSSPNARNSPQQVTINCLP